MRNMLSIVTLILILFAIASITDASGFDTETFINDTLLNHDESTGETAGSLEPESQIKTPAILADKGFISSNTGDRDTLPQLHADGELHATDETPAAFSLTQNSPNPFNPETLIRFTIPQSEMVRLTVYDIMGRVVARPVDMFLAAGTHQIVFDGNSLASGVYFYRLDTGDHSATRKMLLLK